MFRVKRNIIANLFNNLPSHFVSNMFKDDGPKPASFQLASPSGSQRPGSAAPGTGRAEKAAPSVSFSSSNIREPTNNPPVSLTVRFAVTESKKRRPCSVRGAPADVVSCCCWSTGQVVAATKAATLSVWALPSFKNTTTREGLMCASEVTYTLHVHSQTKTIK